MDMVLRIPTMSGDDYGLFQPQVKIQKESEGKITRLTDDIPSCLLVGSGVSGLTVLRDYCSCKNVKLLSEERIREDRQIKQYTCSLKIRNSQ